MKLSVAEREIERISVSNETKFSIKGTSKAFRVLSSSLYRDKIQAIIREVCSNAYDAHVAADRPDAPFEVHLPNALEPFFSVRDYGTGLSEADMNSVYTTYFESTKSGSNKFIGAFGLGSKSPFSYVDSFTITSCLAGMQSTYVAFVNEEGKFSLTRMASIATNQQNGIEVSVPVRHAADYAEFHSKAQLVLSRFKVRPVVVGVPEFGFENHELMLAGKGWRLTTRSQLDTQALAFMGNVAYPIVPSAIEMLDPDARKVLGTPIDLDFPIGALDVTAGREDLSYDKPTLATLERKALAVYKRFPATVAKAIIACPTEYEARLLFGSLFSQGNVCQRLAGGMSVQYGSVVIASRILTLNLAAYPGCRITEVTTTSSRRVRTNTFNSAAEVKIAAFAGTRLVIDDLPRGCSGRVETAFRSADWAKTMVAYVVRGTDQAALKPLLAALKGMPVTMASTLPVAPSRKYDKRPQAVLNATMFNKSSPIHDGFWTVRPVDMSAGGLYVRRSHHYVLNEAGKMDRDFTTLLSRAFALGLFDASTTVVGFDKKTTDMVAMDARWKRFDIHLREKLLGEPAIRNRLNRVAKRLDFDLSVMGNHKLSVFAGEVQRHSDALDPDHLIRVLLRDWFEASRSHLDLHSRNYMDLFQLLNLSADISGGSESFLSRFAAVHARYPLLRYVEANKHQVSNEHFANYIGWVDSFAT